MTDKPMTVGDVRAFIKDLPDDMEVLVPYNEPEWGYLSEMVPLGELCVNDTKNGKVLEICPEVPDY